MAKSRNLTRAVGCLVMVAMATVACSGSNGGPEPAAETPPAADSPATGGPAADGPATDGTVDGLATLVNDWLSRDPLVPDCTPDANGSVVQVVDQPDGGFRVAPTLHNAGEASAYDNLVVGVMLKVPGEGDIAYLAHGANAAVVIPTGRIDKIRQGGGAMRISILNVPPQYGGLPATVPGYSDVEAVMQEILRREGIVRGSPELLAKIDTYVEIAQGIASKVSICGSGEWRPGSGYVADDWDKQRYNAANGRSG